MTLIRLYGCDSHSVQQQDERPGYSMCHFTHNVIDYSNFDKATL